MKGRRFPRPRVAALVVAAAGLASGLAFLIAGTGGAAGDPSTAVTTSAQRVTAAGSGAPDVVDVASLPQARPGSQAVGQSKPFLSPLGAAGLAQAKANASANAPAAEALLPPVAGSGASDAGVPNTPPKLNGFDGMVNGVCTYFGGKCQPPDHGVASDGTTVLQVVNMSVAMYDASTGAILSGFPKSLQDFLNVPAPKPDGCDSAHNDQPFVFDPRAARDPETGRWYVIAAQNENAFGIAPNCNFLSKVHVAVSQTTKPLGAWKVYHFNTKNVIGSGNSAADYPQLGFNGEAIFIGGNQYDQFGNTYNGAWTFAIPKAIAESGGSISSISGFAGYLAFDGTDYRLLDTVQPVVSYGAGPGGPAGEFLIASFNESVTESSVVVFDFSNALAQQGTPQQISGVVVPTKSYSQPPLADNYPTCQNCLETVDNRISATPVYMHGNIYAAHDTAVNNGTATNANVHWMIVHPTITQTTVPGCSLCSMITTKTKVVDDHYLTYKGTTDDWFASIQPDREGNLFMAFEYGSTSGQISPSSALVARRATLQPGASWGGPVDKGGVFLKKAQNATTNSRWGDYEAVGFEGWDSNTLVFATEYAGANKDWATHLDRIKYTSLDQN